MSSRLLSLLGAFRPEDHVVGLAELCHRTGLPPATAHRLLRELVDWGALERADGGAYRIGLRMFEIGMLARGQRALRQVAMPAMQDLYELTHENVHLAILDHTLRLVYLERISGRRSVPSGPDSGGTLPVHATASGKLLLAFSPTETVEQALNRRLVPYTAHTIRNRAQLRDSLAEVRQQGYAVGNEELRLGRVAVAAPIRDANYQVVAALSVVSHSHNVDVSRLVRAVRSNAGAASRQLATSSAGPR